MPKIAINVSPLSDGNKIRGIGYYTKNLVDAPKEIKTNLNYSDFHIELIENCKLKLKLRSYPLSLFRPLQAYPSPNRYSFIVTVHDLIPRQFKSHFPVGIRGEIKWLIQKHRLKSQMYYCPQS